MEAKFIQIFAYLAMTYTLDGFLMSASRRLRLPDFIAHILTGVVLGGVVLIYSHLFGYKTVPDFVDNQFVAFLSYFGMILFLMQMGFSFDLKFFRVNRERIVPQVIIFLLLNVLVMGTVGYFGLTHQSFQATALLIIAFLSINIGALLTSNFPLNPTLKRPITNLIQTAVVVDLIAILFFTGMDLVRYWSDYDGTNLVNVAVYTFILILFLLPLLIPEKMTKLYNATERWIGEFTTVFKIGVFFVFLFACLKLGVSVLLVGIWGGMVFRNLAGENRFDVAEQTFALSSFLYVLPFVQIGQLLILLWKDYVFFWSSLAYILIGLILVSTIFGLIFLKKQRYAKLLAMGVFARGELTLLILWLGFRVNYIGKELFIVSVIAVILSSLIGKAMFLRPFEAQQQST
ncbi:MAG: cation:proton antiporter [Calditrichia bacterium]